ncbi:DUF5996 family protein [Alkalicoccus luteus]|uniref:DUF5996 family protein n=1 Tax=Alkalicoccus luteus TaxID=1237094 RepID=UPI004033467C
MHHLKHEDWKDTKMTLHLLSQILGKVRLEMAEQQPQWAHVTLPLTPGGFTTGRLYHNESCFSIELNVLQHKIIVTCEGERAIIPLEDGTTIQSYYRQLAAALEQFGCPVSIFTKPQEMTYVTPFESCTDVFTYDPELAVAGFRLFQHAERELTAFLAPLRTRKVMPALFWGTFDVSGLIVSDRYEPFPEDKVIEKGAFDEQFVEFGFWTGDEQVNEPTYFVLPYPFLFQELTSGTLEPEDAWYDASLSEAFYRGSDVQTFLTSSFTLLAEELGWEKTDHIFRPLSMPPQKNRR